jgi:hypothetical protein
MKRSEIKEGFYLAGRAIRVGCSTFQQPEEFAKIAKVLEQDPGYAVWKFGRVVWDPGKRLKNTRRT